MTLLTFEDVVGGHAACNDLTAERVRNIRQRLLPAVWTLQHRMGIVGIQFRENPKTGTIVSGETLGGFRPQACSVGAPFSNHKAGLAVDLYDPDGRIDAWILANLVAVAECKVWIEHPDATPGWSHWQAVPPRSGKTVFRP